MYESWLDECHQQMSGGHVNVSTITPKKMTDHLKGPVEAMYNNLVHVLEDQKDNRMPPKSVMFLGAHVLHSGIPRPKASGKENKGYKGCQL